MARNKRLMYNLQIKLGLPEVDRTKTRQAVRAYFAVYRKYKLLLEMDMEPHPEPVKALPGYKNAVDPDLIRGNRVHPGIPRSFDTPMESPEDARRRAFVEDVERRVNHLPPYQRDIIRYQYMGRETPGRESRLPSDTETYQYLRSQGWYVSERYYDEEKQKAIMTLAAAFRIEQF